MTTPESEGDWLAEFVAELSAAPSDEYPDWQDGSDLSRLHIEAFARSQSSAVPEGRSTATQSSSRGEIRARVSSGENRTRASGGKTRTRTLSREIGALRKSLGGRLALLQVHAKNAPRRFRRITRLFEELRSAEDIETLVHIEDAIRAEEVLAKRRSARAKGRISHRKERK